MDRISEIKSRCDAATNGPWKSDMMGMYVFKGKEATIAEMRGWGYLTDSLRLSGEEAKMVQKANADFIACAREDIPYLLDEINRLTSEIEKYRQGDNAVVNSAHT